MTGKDFEIKELPDELKNLWLDDPEACRLEDLEEVPLGDIEDLLNTLYPEPDLEALLIPYPDQKDLEDAPSSGDLVEIES